MCSCQGGLLCTQRPWHGSSGLLEALLHMQECLPARKGLQTDFLYSCSLQLYIVYTMQVARSQTEPHNRVGSWIHERAAGTAAAHPPASAHSQLPVPSPFSGLLPMCSEGTLLEHAKASHSNRKPASPMVWPINCGTLAERSRDLGHT